METILLLTLKTDTRTTHFAHAKRVVGLHAHHFLNTATLFLRVRFGTDGKNFQFGILTRVNPRTLHHFVKARYVRGHRMKGSRTEVRHELNLTQGISGSCRDGQHAHTLGAILKSETAGKHAVTAGILEDIVGAKSHHPKITCHLVCPLFQVLLRVKDYRGRTCRTAGRMQASAFTKGHTRHAEGIGVAQICLCGERNFANVVKTLDVLGFESDFLKALLVEWRIHAVTHGCL